MLMHDNVLLCILTYYDVLWHMVIHYDIC